MSNNERNNLNTKPSAVPQKPENPGLSTGGQVDSSGKFPGVSFIDGLRTIELSDFKEVHKKPCVRESFLTGIGAGFGIGGLRAILGGKSPGSTQCTISLTPSSSCSRSLQLGGRIIHIRLYHYASILPVETKRGEAELQEDR